MIGSPLVDERQWRFMQPTVRLLQKEPGARCVSFYRGSVWIYPCQLSRALVPRSHGLRCRRKLLHLAEGSQVRGSPLASLAHLLIAKPALKHAISEGPASGCVFKIGGREKKCGFPFGRHPKSWFSPLRPLRPWPLPTSCCGSRGQRGTRLR